MKDLICPKCHKKGFEARHVWDATQRESDLKCSACGEWSFLKEWTGPGMFKVEKSRAYIKYPQSLWESMTHWDMYRALEQEMLELHAAFHRNEISGEHGVIRESIHVQVVAQRIQDEMSRRANDNGKNTHNQA